MPPRENPTARQARLGAELRKLRERAGRTAREAAGMLGTDQGKISHIESGRIGVSEERIRKLATFYSCSDHSLLDALCAIAREHRGQYWWDEYRGILAPGPLNVAELEHHAVAMQIMQTVSVPGLLQTEEYARALFRGVVPELPAEEIETRTEFRMRRKVVLEGDNPPPFDVFVHEAALRMRFGGRATVRRQLEFLMNASEGPGVSVRVIPFTNEDYFEATQPVLYATGVVPQLDTVQIDGIWGGGFLDAEAELSAYRVYFSRAAKVSLNPEESRQIIHHIAREL
ncbi:helix-turn-helix transcriptional regulator [Streptomyces sp. DSM 44917]|uniref:Helix-turn-helix transcriptional regulator n=1 Tax=Streptomyces boetiae TaxID=3075541 RepID=A0ABU2L1K8_9ACTN|nr:helix-turn-helix transcriptional regulator [Streptomyces sp. DSM 44917]MDT0305446.1 helix-turn-helix transcriptional regulator [Streptomyces sp. DSM 44917]